MNTAGPAARTATSRHRFGLAKAPSVNPNPPNPLPRTTVRHCLKTSAALDLISGTGCHPPRGDCKSLAVPRILGTTHVLTIVAKCPLASAPRAEAGNKLVADAKSAGSTRVAAQVIPAPAFDGSGTSREGSSLLLRSERSVPNSI